jgi:hypothetical protein
MTFTTTVAIGFCSGLHAAMYGAYKDSPHESFLLRRLARELVFATIIAAGLAAGHLADGQSAFVVYLSVFALSRIVTEFWKLFVRVEPQGDFRIPTQIHWLKTPVRNPALRLLAGFGFLGAIYGCYRLFGLLPDSLLNISRGLVVGGGIGLAEALAGAYKDGSIEGFSPVKFLKSPTFGAIGGLIASLHTADLAFLLLAAIGSMRMFLELLFKVLVRGYAPGKFRSMTGPFTEWVDRRRYFLVPYAATWLLYLSLFVQIA